MSDIDKSLLRVAADVAKDNTKLINDNDILRAEVARLTAERDSLRSVVISYNDLIQGSEYEPAARNILDRNEKELRAKLKE